jgi:hypothetical protein
MPATRKSNCIVLALMLARTSSSFVSAFTQHASRRIIAPSAASAFVNWHSQKPQRVSSPRWMSEGDAPAEKTDEEKAAIKAVREARK